MGLSTILHWDGGGPRRHRAMTVEVDQRDIGCWCQKPGRAPQESAHAGATKKIVAVPPPLPSTFGRIRILPDYGRPVPRLDTTQEQAEGVGEAPAGRHSRCRSAPSVAAACDRARRPLPSPPPLISQADPPPASPTQTRRTPRRCQRTSTGSTEPRRPAPSTVPRQLG